MMKASVICSVIANEYLGKMMSSEESPDLCWDLLLRQKRENDRAYGGSANLFSGLERGQEAEQPGGRDNK